MDILTTSVDIAATLLAALVFGPAFAHVLEQPGKARLSSSDYFTVQQIYVPGFTRAGAATEVRPYWSPPSTRAWRAGIARPPPE